MTMRSLLPAFLVLLSLSASATELPLTTPWLDAPPGDRPRTASSRDGYATVWVNRELEQQVQLVRHDSTGSRLDDVPIRVAGPAAGYADIASDGTDYVAVWDCPRNAIAYTCSALITADGAVELRTPMPGYSSRIASDGSGYLVVMQRDFGPAVEQHTIHAQPLDTRGHRAGAEFAVGTGVQSPRIASNGTNYLIAWMFMNLTGVLADERGLLGSPNPIDDRAFAALDDASIASDGRDYLAAWPEAVGQAGTGWKVDLRATRISGTTGTVASPVRTLSSEEKPSRRPALVWTGDRYAMSYTVDRSSTYSNLQPTDGQVRMLELGPDATPLGPPVIVSGDLPAANSSSIAHAGGATAVIFETGVQGEYYALTSALYHARVDTTVEAGPLARSARSETSADMVTTANDQLVAWTQPIGHAMTSTLFVTRRSSGQRIGVHASSREQLRPALAWDQGALVVWIERTRERAAPGELMMSRLGTNGEVVGSATAIGRTARDAEPAVTATASGFFVVWPDETGRILATRVSRSGEVLDTTPIQVAGPGRNVLPSVAAQGSRVVVAWLAESIEPCQILCPIFYDGVATTMNEDGSARTNDLRLASYADRVIAVARPGTFAVFWRGYGGDASRRIGGSLLTTTGLLLASVPLEGTGRLTDAIWDGSRYRVSLEGPVGAQMGVLTLDVALGIVTSTPLYTDPPRRLDPQLAVSADGSLIILHEKVDPLAPYFGARRLVIHLAGSGRTRATR